MYVMGKGVDQNYETAFSLFNKAAAKEQRFAENMLGYMYAEGLGVKQDGEWRDGAE